MKRKFNVWVHAQKDWVPAPKASEEQLLLAGEGRVYKLRDIGDLPGLERFKFLALPRADRLAIDPDFMAPIPYTSREDDALAFSERDSSPVPEPPSSSLPPTPTRTSGSQPGSSLGKRSADNCEPLASKKRHLACQHIAAVLGVPEPEDARLRNGKGKAKEHRANEIDERALTDDDDDEWILTHDDEWALTDEELALLFWSTQSNFHYTRILSVMCA